MTETRSGARSRGRWARSLRSWAGAGLLVVLTAGVALAKAGILGLPYNVSEQGERVDGLYKGIFYLVAVMFFLTEGALIYFIIRYRARPGAKPYYIEGSAKAEWIWTLVPGLILLVLALTQVPVWVALKVRPPAAEDAFRVEAMAQQFNWNFRHPGADGVFGTPDDVTSPKLNVPVGKPVILQIRSRDVIHSFFLPNLRIKQDATPGLTTQTWFTARETGDFEIACAELCGLAHYRMRSFLSIKPVAEVQTWLDGETKRVVSEGGEDPSDNWGWGWQRIAQCSAPIPGEWKGGKPAPAAPAGESPETPAGEVKG